MDRKWTYMIYMLCISLEVEWSQGYFLNKTACEGSLCLYLYEDDLKSTSWQQSYDNCVKEGQRFLIIDNAETQILVEKLLKHLPTSQKDQVWTAGRGSSDGTWRYMNGTNFPNQSGISGQNVGINCVFASIIKSDPVRVIQYTADNCDEEYSSSQLLCQYDPETTDTGECDPDHMSLGGKCYVKTTYAGRDDMPGSKISWFDGQSYCSSRYPDGTIAYSNFHNSTFMSSLLNLLGNANTVDIWLGIRRRIWHWRIGSDQGNRYSMNYFNWRTTQGRYPTFDLCIYINHGVNDEWFTQSCVNRLTYFICMNVTDDIATTTPTTTTTITTTTTTTPTTTKTTTSTTTTTTTTTTPTVTTTITPSEPGTPTSTSTTNTSLASTTTATSDSRDTITEASVSNPKSEIGLYAGSAVGGLVVVVVIVVVTIICVRRKKKHQEEAEKHHYVNENFDQEAPAVNRAYTGDDTLYEEVETDANVPVDEATYADVTPVDAEVEIMPDDSINPYAEVGLGKRVSGFFKRKLSQAPSMRKTSATNNNAEHGRIKFSKTTKPSISDKPKSDKNDKPSKGKKAVKHKTTEQGDIYALPDKSGNLAHGTTPQIEHIVTDEGDMYALPMKKT